MNAEYTFIRSLEAYFDEKFNDFTLNRIKTLLSDYKKSIPKERIVVKSLRQEDPTPIPDVMKFDLSKGNYKKIPEKGELLEELNKLCLIYDVTVDEVLLKSKNKTKSKIIEIRKKFCQMAMQNYICTTNFLADFLNVHHTTISYYIYGKQYRLK
jgi:hypothetical protein